MAWAGGNSNITGDLTVSGTVTAGGETALTTTDTLQNLTLVVGNGTTSTKSANIQSGGASIFTNLDYDELSIASQTSGTSKYLLLDSVGATKGELSYNDSANTTALQARAPLTVSTTTGDIVFSTLTSTERMRIVSATGDVTIGADLTVSGAIDTDDITLTNLLSKTSLATDSAGKIIEGSAAATTFQATINTYYNFTAATKGYIPLAGSTSESASLTNQRILMPANSGNLLKLRIHASGAGGSTVFTLEDSAGVLGTLTVNIAAANTIYEIDFTGTLDSGTNAFDGTKYLGIGVDPTTNMNDVNIVSVWEFDV